MQRSHNVGIADVRCQVAAEPSHQMLQGSQFEGTDDALTFGADDFVTGTLKMNINDNGGTDRFGTLELFDEDEAGN